MILPSMILGAPVIVYGLDLSIVKTSQLTAPEVLSSEIKRPSMVAKTT